MVVEMGKLTLKLVNGLNWQDLLMVDPECKGTEEGKSGSMHM